MAKGVRKPNQSTCLPFAFTGDVMMIPITEQLWSALRMYLGTQPHDHVRPMCDGLDTCKAQWQAEEQIKQKKAAERLTKQSKEKVTPIDRKKKKEGDE